MWGLVHFEHLHLHLDHLDHLDHLELGCVASALHLVWAQVTLDSNGSQNSWEQDINVAKFIHTI